MDEYLENACISVGGHAAMVHAYILRGCTLTNDSVDCIKRSSDLIYWSSLITRLSDDLGTEEVCLIQNICISSRPSIS